MTQTTSRRKLFRKKIIFWLVFIALLMLGVHVLFQEYRTTHQTHALIKELKNRSLNYALQLQKGVEIKEVFPVLASTGNTIEPRFLLLQNMLEITVKDVHPRICQKVIRSDYQDPVEITVNNMRMDRRADDCPSVQPIHLAFYYRVPGTEASLNQMVSPNNTAEVIGTALQQATLPLEQPVETAPAVNQTENNLASDTSVPVVAPQAEPVVQSVAAPVQPVSETVKPATRLRSPLRRFVRRKVLPGETLGDVVSSENKKKILMAKIVALSKQSYADLRQPVLMVPPIRPEMPVSEEKDSEQQPVLLVPQSDKTSDIDAILEQDAIKNQRRVLPQQSMSLQLENYPSEKEGVGLEQFLEPIPPVHPGVRDAQPSYQRPIYDGTAYLSRTGIHLMH